MEKSFWHERWERQEIGFHQNEINPFLARHWQELQLSLGAKIFVPLCGKSLDMLWLRDQGHAVLGVELSPIAVQAFFRGNGYTPEHTAKENFDYYEAGSIRILCGDFFNLKKEDMKGVSAVYDRASLVALPPAMRERYVRHLLGILPPATRILLISFDYRQPEMPGPPFAVSIEEVESLYKGCADIRLLAQHDTLDENPRFRERGLTRLQENIFLLKLNP